MLEYVHYPVLPLVKAHLIINCVLQLLTLGVVALRMFDRLRLRGGLGWDDGLILAAMPQAFGMLVIQGLWSQMGVGYDISQVPTNTTLILKLLVAYELIYSTSIATVKLSILFFYLRTFIMVSTSLRLMTKYVVGLVTLWTIGNILQVFLMCRPFESTYNPSVPGTCGNQVASFISIGAFNIITDVLILTMPLQTVWNLKMNKSTKVGFTVVFLLGLLTSVVGLLRIFSLTSVDLDGNLTGTMIYADFLSATEPNLAILCVSLPTLSGMYKRYMRPVKTLVTGGRSHSGNTGGGAAAGSRLGLPSGTASGTGLQKWRRMYDDDDENDENDNSFGMKGLTTHIGHGSDEELTAGGAKEAAVRSYVNENEIRVQNEIKVKNEICIIGGVPEEPEQSVKF